MPKTTEKKLTVTAENSDALLETPLQSTEFVRNTRILTCDKDETFSTEVEPNETVLVTIVSGSVEINFDQIDPTSELKPQSNTIRCTGPATITTRCLTKISSMALLTLRP